MVLKAIVSVTISSSLKEFAVGQCLVEKFALLLNFVLVLNKSAKKVSSTEV
jgi:hypothetical protein